MTCEVSVLLYDVDYESLAVESRKAVEPKSSLHLLKILNFEDASDWIQSPPNYHFEVQGHAQVHESTIAYLRHTSGTSTGLPKPIPQSHHGAVGVLPRLSGHDHASFSTTPLYHGGVADCFRAWTSDALIWLFPGKEVPITGLNVLKSLVCCQGRSEFSPVKYFSSVPYVLQMLGAVDDGLKLLQQMDIVGVGGAALAKEIGDDLVEKGVNLISRFGSVECGFLLSSHRDYQNETDWQFLRNRAVNLLHFEARDNGLAELVILRDWPHMAKRNRTDGSFATADLFEPHSSIPNVWRHHSRADSQLTLATGKKFDPAPFEDAIATSSLISDVLIFGNDRSYPGALLFRSASSEKLTPDILLDNIWPTVEKLNSEGQAHTRLSKAMLVVMPSNAPSLEKSSKGTVLRRQAEVKYRPEINLAYERGFVLNDEVGFKEHDVYVPDHEMIIKVSAIIKAIVTSNDSIPENADLYSLGVDSVACMQIRNVLQRVCSPYLLNLIYADAESRNYLNLATQHYLLILSMTVARLNGIFKQVS